MYRYKLYSYWGAWEFLYILHEAKRKPTAEATTDLALFSIKKKEEKTLKKAFKSQQNAHLQRYISHHWAMQFFSKKNSI